MEVEHLMIVASDYCKFHIVTKVSCRFGIFLVEKGLKKNILSCNLKSLRSNRAAATC